MYAFSDILRSLGHGVDPSSQMWMDICVADWLSSMDREIDVFSIYFIVRRGRTLIPRSDRYNCVEDSIHCILLLFFALIEPGSLMNCFHFNVCKFMKWSFKAFVPITSL